MKLIRFTTHWGSYNEGESAGFREPKADALVDRGVAEYVHAAKTSPVAKGEVADTSAAEPEATSETPPEPKPRRGRTAKKEKKVE